MKRKGHILSILFAAGFMLLLILDSDTTYAGASEGVLLCINVIIPSLFPFFVVSTYLNHVLQGRHIPGLERIGRYLHIPKGSESILAVGLLGGYPVGAQLIADAYRQGTLDKKTGNILLGYCSNGGPAFIFGVAGSLFSSIRITFFLWLVHMFSALVTGFLLPRPTITASKVPTPKSCSIVQSLRKSISVCASVCGWIILFKILIRFLNRCFISKIPPVYLTILSGLLELSNGCIQLNEIENEALRFILCSLFLGFGGICVTLQTMSVTESIGLGLYIPGKIMQASISLILSLLIAPYVFTNNGIHISINCLVSLLCVPIIHFIKIYCKKRCGNPENNHV